MTMFSHTITINRRPIIVATKAGRKRKTNVMRDQAGHEEAPEIARVGAKRLVRVRP